MKLSDRLVASLAPSNKQQEIPDSLLPGLYLRIMPTGVKSWTIRYRTGGKQRRLTLGKYPMLGLADARERARSEMMNVAKGVDVQAEKAQRQRDGDDDIASVIDLFIERHAKEHNKTWREVERVLKRHALPAWKGRKIDSIQKKDVISLIDGVYAHAPIQANRLLSSTRKFLNWCVSRDLIKVSPANGVAPPAKEQKRDRILTDIEVKAFWKACEKEGYPFGHAFRLLLVTGQRRGEVMSLPWSEIDMKGKIWELPPERTKNNKPHRVVLTAHAVDIFEACPRIMHGGEDVDLVFPARGNPFNPASGLSKAKERIDTAMLKALGVAEIPRWTLHDLRRTFASGCRRAGVPLDVVEKTINHISGSFGGVAGVYQLHNYEPEKKTAMAAWHKLLTKILAEDKVVVLNPQKAHR